MVDLTPANGCPFIELACTNIFVVVSMREG